MVDAGSRGSRRALLVEGQPRRHLLGVDRRPQCKRLRADRGRVAAPRACSPGLVAAVRARPTRGILRPASLRQPALRTSGSPVPGHAGRQRCGSRSEGAKWLCAEARVRSGPSVHGPPLQEQYATFTPTVPRMREGETPHGARLPILRRSEATRRARLVLELLPRTRAEGALADGAARSREMTWRARSR